MNADADRPFIEGVTIDRLPITSQRDEYPVFTYTYRTDAGGTIVYEVRRSGGLSTRSVVHVNDGANRNSDGVVELGNPVDNLDSTATIRLRFNKSDAEWPSQFFEVHVTEE